MGTNDTRTVFTDLANGARIGCIMRNITQNSTIWQMENPMDRSLPVLFLQLGLMIFLTRLLHFILRPLRQPRFVAEMIAGIIIGPILFTNSHYPDSGHKSVPLESIFTNSDYSSYLGHKSVPSESILLLETFSNLALSYYMFLVGLEMDLTTITHMEKRSFSIAIAAAGTLIPFCTGAGLYYLPTNNDTRGYKGALLWGIALTITSFPDLARILSDVKLIRSDLGRMALNTAMISDISAWVLVVTAITFFDEHELYLVVPPSIAFLAICWFCVRPALASIIRRTRGKYEEAHIHFALAGVAICGFITDACGMHTVVGGFIFGLVFPSGDLAIKIMERTQEMVTGFMLPAFIFINGLRITDLTLLGDNCNWKLVILVIILGTLAKIVSSIIVFLYLGMSLRDGFALGSLMNTKGVFALIVLNEGRSLKALDADSFTVMEITVLLMTVLVGPILFLANRTSKHSRQYMNRSIQRSTPASKLRILTCIHSARNLSGVMKILEISNATRKSPIWIFVVHLVELVGRASSMLIVHDTRKTRTTNDNIGCEKTETDQIMNAFEKYENRNEAVTVIPLTAVSSYSTMHEDILNLAEEKRCRIILIPFHKDPVAGGGLQGNNHSISEVNQNLLVQAPCSVAILIDRGLGSLNNRSGLIRITMLFIGGPDDQEALSYAWRMTGAFGVNLTVVRFLQDKDSKLNIMLEDEKYEDTNLVEDEIANGFDDEFINEFRFKTMCDQSITYHEKVAKNCVEVVQSIRTKCKEVDLYIVGRGQGVKSPLTMGLSEWSENPELGPIGETLASSEFAAHASILVVQQSILGGIQTCPEHHKKRLGRTEWASPILNPDYAAFVNHKKN